MKAEKKGCVKGSRDGCGGEKSDGDGESEDAKDGRVCSLQPWRKASGPTKREPNL